MSWKTRTSGSQAQIGQRYHERKSSYPYGARTAPSGAPQEPRARTVDSMKFQPAIRPQGKYSLARERMIHSARSERAQKIDESIQANKIVGPSPEWEHAPNRMDIPGVDYFSTPTSKTESKKLNFELNNQLIRHDYEDQFPEGSANLSNVKWVRKGTPEAKDVHFVSGAYAHYESSTHRLAFTKPCGDMIARGTVKDRQEAYAMSSLAHEMGHAVRGQAGFASYSRTSRSGAVEEGSNSITAARFTLNRLQMDRQVRKDLQEKPEYLLPYGYRGYADETADAALLANNGDEQKAVKWIDQLRVEKDQQKFVTDSGVAWDDLFSGRIQQTLMRKNIKPSLNRDGKGYNDRFWYLVV